MNSLVKNYKDQIRDLIDSAESIGIFAGNTQNIDITAASLAFYLLLRGIGKNVQIISRREPTVEVSNLFGVDKIGKTFDGNTKMLTISVPNHNDEIEKVSYNLEGNRLNVNLFADEKGISFNENEVEYIKKGSAPSLVITLAAKSEDVANIYDPATTKTIHLDKNPMNDLAGDVMLVDPTFSSLSEIVTEIAIDLGYFDADAFQNLMDGVAFATRNFTNPATSAFAFEAAGFLMQNGAQRKERERRDDRQRGNFPSESHFLNQNQGQNDRRQKNRNQNQNQGQNQNQNRGRFDGNRQRNQQQTQGQQYTQPEPQMSPIQDGQYEEATPVASPTQSPLQNDFVDNNYQEDYKFSDPVAVDSQPADNSAASSEIPEDWFLPKVFKGSKKTNN